MGVTACLYDSICGMWGCWRMGKGGRLMGMTEGKKRGMRRWGRMGTGLEEKGTAAAMMMIRLGMEVLLGLDEHRGWGGRAGRG